MPICSCGHAEEWHNPNCKYGPSCKCLKFRGKMDILVDPPIRIIQERVHQIAQEHGWYDDAVKNELAISQRLLLTHCEISEAVECLRIDPPPVSTKLPGVPQLSEELADVVIRIMDLCEWLKLDLEAAVLAKIEYNNGRPYKHGKKF